MKSASKLCAILFLATTLVAQTSTSSKSKKAKPAPVTAADVQALKDALAAQQSVLAAQQQVLGEHFLHPRRVELGLIGTFSDRAKLHVAHSKDEN